MSKANYNNRHQVVVPVKTNADARVLALYAHKKLIVREAVLVNGAGAIAASGSNYLGSKLQKAPAGSTPADVTGATSVDTQAGIVAYGKQSLTLPEYEPTQSPGLVLEKGEALYLNADITGTLSVDAQLSLDVEVVGN